MKKLHFDLRANGVRVVEGVRPAWVAKGYVGSSKVSDPESNKVEVRCYDATG